MAATKVESSTLSVTKCQQYLGIGKKTFYLLRKDPSQGFPPPFRVLSMDLWRREDVDAWKASRLRASAVPGLAA
jgi:predicted DNA-binding transcriptional regulator AlpA